MIVHIVPSAYLRQTRRRLSREGQQAAAVTLGGLAAQILRAGLVPYTENRLLEEIALWQSVQDLEGSLDFFAPISQFKGFIAELKWLFNRIDYGEEVFGALPNQGRQELALLHRRYHQILQEHGVVNAPGRLQLALDLMKRQQVLPDVRAIRLEGLTELRPLEEAFVQALAQGRSLEVVQPQVQPEEIRVCKAADPAAEVEQIGLALRSQLEQGTPVEALAVAFPNPSQYLPIIMPVFERLHIPWQPPGLTLRNTPVGKTLLTLLAGELAGWDKRALELLTAPGWGFPCGLTPEEHRLLRLAPPLKGLPAWRSYLGQSPGWERVLSLVAQLGEELRARPLAEYGRWLEGLLAELDPELWVDPQEDLENWAQLVKAWDGLNSIAQTLQGLGWTATPGKFLQLLEALLDSYVLRPRRTFAERVQVLAVEQLGGCPYQYLYVGGLVEGQFPPSSRTHWLTKTRAEAERDALYARLTTAARHLWLYYPEVDREGKLNLPATVLPPAAAEKGAARLTPVHRPTLFLGTGRLRDERLVQELREKVLKEGLSVSELNTYAGCPYRFFCAHVLGLEVWEEESLELDAREKGIIIHSVLRTFWERHLTGPLPSLPESQVLVEELVTQAYLEQGFQPPADLIRTMRAFIRRDLQRVQRGFRPVYLEHEFKDVVIPTASGPVRLRGRIDRIDLHPSGVYVLYDYKTGTPPTTTELLEGKDVQVGAYLLAAQAFLPKGCSVGAAYYSIDSGTLRGVFHERYSAELDVHHSSIMAGEDFAQQLESFERIVSELVNSLLAGVFPIEPVGSRMCRYCPFQGICRKEVSFSGF